MASENNEGQVDTQVGDSGGYKQFINLVIDVPVAVKGAWFSFGLTDYLTDYLERFFSKHVGTKG